MAEEVFEEINDDVVIGGQTVIYNLSIQEIPVTPSTKNIALNDPNVPALYTKSTLGLKFIDSPTTVIPDTTRAGKPINYQLKWSTSATGPVNQAAKATVYRAVNPIRANLSPQPPVYP
ncbi:MAG: hypothetical protein HOP34_12125 [Methylococcaceae bacterium]|nr:hypothetical protein [Methylococcaceae bacterium]